MDVLARYGGEEFTLVLPVCDAEQACALIERLRPRMPDRQTFSAGVAKWNGTDSAEALLRAADAALMQAKSAGRNRTVVWGNEPQVTLPLTA
jgi:diguanylate cyclase (GGDEF)-like protein